MGGQLLIMKFILSLVSFLICVQDLYANVNTKYSLRRCMQLPISGQTGSGNSFRVYEQIEIYLKRNDWCDYQSNSSVLTILQNYQPNLDRHLEKAEVLRKIADKTRSGSLIHIKMHTMIDSVDLSMKVIGDNGQDIFFSEKMRLRNNDIDLISQTVISWLNIYEKTIPYDGRVIGVLDKQFTIDLGAASKIFVGNNLRVIRPMRKNNHPLLNEIVGWETEMLGKGKVLNVSESQSLAEITEYSIGQHPRSGDWVIREGTLNKEVQKVTEDSEPERHELGQIGTLSIGTKIGGGSDATSVSGLARKIMGLIFGFHFKGELWATRNYWLSLELERNIGSYLNNTKGAVLNSVGLIQDIFKFKLGYKYLPLGFFWGPQIDLYLGYGIYSYDLEISKKEGFGHHRTKGLLLGLRGNFPFHKLFRGFMKLDFLPFPNYEEETNIFGGEVKSTTSYQIELGAHYHYSPRITIDGSFEITSNKVRFGGNDGFNLNEMALKAGVTFAY